MLRRIGRAEEVRDGAVHECGVEVQRDIQREPFASKLAQVLPVGLQRCARLAERPIMVEEIELTNIRGHDER